MQVVAWHDILYLALNNRRKELIKDQQSALNIRKSLSSSIGKLMKEKKEVEVQELKAQVEQASQTAAKAEEELLQVNTATTAICLLKSKSDAYIMRS